MKTEPLFSAAQAECKKKSFSTCLLAKLRYIKSIMKNRFSKLLLLIGAVALSGLFSGCIAFDRDTSMLAPHKWSEIKRNRINLGKLRVKMTKQEVLEIMGEPLKGEIFCNDKVWWYYTRTCWNDFMTTRDECTPVVFGEDDDLVEGWGVTYYRNNYDYRLWPNKVTEKAIKK